ncbi:MBL fold metallo-hydrolase [Ruixingdingia sedimenti]|uniref:MBL fold metallo-hydrolase n=1 Tax=Ruixingdingia sedimenti TaxID=3073604 RepID=A0ABU1F2G8_9RHOB|nr:MBL fold metallo-hydrolase [Xinfangfangia sp. LG-4]MDR5651042.1 MBL fold metallo-hydrolase [Xinfangfangia sp. LG-4]
MTRKLTRRQTLAAGAALPLAAALAPAWLPAAAEAKTTRKGMAIAPFLRFNLGAFEVTTLLSGTRTVDGPAEIFGLNADPAEFKALSDAAFIATDRSQFFFTPTLVNTGAELVLFDTGLSAEGMVAALAAAGYAPEDIDVVVLTHMHGDHIGGMMTDGAPTFANARYVTGAVEHNHWMGAGNEGFDTAVRPLNERFTFVDDGAAVTGGITAMATFGHTPGHMSWILESADQRLAVIGDVTNHPVWSLARPEWEVRFDADKATAAATRRRLLGMLAADRMPFIGYHMPFPGVGYVATEGEGFRYVPGHARLMMNAPV